MLLRIAVNKTTAMPPGHSDFVYRSYLAATQTHNEQMLTNPHPDAGFDLFSPTHYDCSSNKINMIYFDICCEAKIVYENGRELSTGFYLHPRSSTGSKTPLRLANGTGIIDAGYRGQITAAFDCKVDNYHVNKGDKLVQLCAPGLVPIYVELVDKLETENTVRGQGGFGSTTSR
jgi:dUTP pyrophosphatase